jgi:hypothetical protein
VTHLAFEDRWGVRAWREGPKYKVGPSCANPDCDRFADHAHHIQRRSFFGHGVPCNWITVPQPTLLGTEEITVGNLAGLCFKCHDDVTQNKQRIQWLDQFGFIWINGLGERRGKLNPHPPYKTALSAAGDSLAGSHPQESGSAEGHDHADLTECDSCHGTGRTPRRRKAPAELKPGEKRRKGTWSVHVPKDAEDGAEILDALLQPVADKLGRGSHKSWRYFTLVEALVWVNQHLDLIEQEAA